METNAPLDSDFTRTGTRLPAVDRALSLLELLANSQSGLTLSELSRKMRIPKSTTHYLLHTLTTRGYVQPIADGRHYSLGLRLSEITDSNRARNRLTSLLTPFLHDVANKLKLTAIATILIGAEGVIIAKFATPLDPGSGAWVGRHIDLHCTAQGKALIAQLPQNRLLELFRGRDPAQFTSKTISNLTALQAHLALVRQQGYAVNDEENVLGLRAVGAPINIPRGSVIAAVSVRGGTREIPTGRISQLGAEMIRVARDVSRELEGDRGETLFASRS